MRNVEAFGLIRERFFISHKLQIICVLWSTESLSYLDGGTGHTPNNARIVITEGIMDLLDPPEPEAVVAHEIGHVVHWDMLVMTVAYLVPYIEIKSIVRGNIEKKCYVFHSKLFIAILFLLVGIVLVLYIK